MRFAMLALALLPAFGQAKKPMTFLDALSMRTAGSPALSADGKWLLYTLSVPDWKEGKSFTDVYLTGMETGARWTRRMTYTRTKNESGPQWSRDGQWFAFLSDRDGGKNQLYAMRPNGGEALRISDAKDGVHWFGFSRDGKWLAFLAGKDEKRQVWTVGVGEMETAAPKPLTKHESGVRWAALAPDSGTVYFVAADSPDKDNAARVEKKFTVKIRNEELPLEHLWAFDLTAKKERRLTGGQEYSVGSVTISRDGRWMGFRGTPKDRYRRTVTEAPSYSDLYLLETATGKIERLTENKEIGESAVSFSPDGKRMAFSAAADFEYFRERRIWVRRTEDAGGKWRVLGGEAGYELGVDFWSADGKTIYSNVGIRATGQLAATDVESGKSSQVTNAEGVIEASWDEDAQRMLIRYSDPVSPGNLYTVKAAGDVAKRAAWIALTDTNPQIREMALGETAVVRWKSSDGQEVEGVLVKPVGYEKGKRYPLIVQIHGGPASASTLSFNAGYANYSHVYAGDGYACLLPNYRGSANYGEKFRTMIANDYFRLGYDDIMSGVDTLVKEGIADPEKLGAMGWSAGGHWSNWILTHTTRFKAISSGAGTVNWISMYAQTDVQRNREHYFGGLPYGRFEEHWRVSPLKYIEQAKTPTLIHVVEGDPRVPRPQSEELHMALKKLGVPTELMVYPGTTHGIPDARNQMVKMVSEFAWFEKWIRGKQGWFEWKDLLATIPGSKEAGEKPASEEKEP